MFFLIFIVFNKQLAFLSFGGFPFYWISVAWWSESQKMHE